MTFQECDVCKQQVAVCLTDREKPDARVLLCDEHWAELAVWRANKLRGAPYGPKPPPKARRRRR